MISSALLLTLAACSAGAPAGNPEPAEKMKQPAAFRVIEAGEYGAAANSSAGAQDARPAADVARDPATYRQLWAKYAGASPAPEVDFSRETVLFLGLGQQSTGGYGITPSSVNVDSGTATVETSIRAPRSDSIVAMVITAPFAVVAVSDRDVKRVVWRAKDMDEPLAQSMEKNDR